MTNMRSIDRSRCRRAGIPDEVVYRPKTEIALELYDRAVANGVHFEWLTFDEWYGGKPPFLRAKSQLNRAVRTFPKWRCPVGEGAKRTRTFSV